MAISFGGALGPRAGIEPIDAPATSAVVFDYTAILSGRTWYGAGASNHPVILTYSFSSGAQPYLAAAGFTDDFIASFVPFSEADKTLARNAIAQWANASGIVAIEAPAGQGDIQFGRFDFSEEPVMSGFDGYAFYPSVLLSQTAAVEGALGGDVFINSASGLYMWLALHEFGHALGFKHPFDGSPTLPPALDDTAHTVMSYSGGAASILGPFDHDAVEFLYGNPDSDGTHVASWSWNAATATLTQIGTADADTIRGVYGSDIISGAVGDDLVFGSFGLDVLEGNAGSDTIFGWDGDDRLKGGKKADHLDGGAGMDTFAYPVAKDLSGPGYDTIVGFDAAGADRIDIHSRVRAVEAAVDDGNLSAASFNADLAAAMAEANLRPRDAVLFVPDAGTLAGKMFLVIDLNREGGYQADEDLVILLDGAVNIAGLDVADFV